MKLSYVLEALKNGAVLHHSLARKPTWELYNGTTIKTVSSTQMKCLLKREAIVSAGDSLFAEIPAQTWRYAEPIEGAP
jgi:hypothetical protein